MSLYDGLDIENDEGSGTKPAVAGNRNELYAGLKIQDKQIYQ